MSDKPKGRRGRRLKGIVEKMIGARTLQVSNCGTQTAYLMLTRPDEKDVKRSGVPILPGTVFLFDISPDGYTLRRG